MRDLFIIMLNAVRVSVVMLSVVAWIRNLYYKAFYSGKNVNNCLNTNIYSYLETSGSKVFNLHLNFVHSFNTSVN